VDTEGVAGLEEEEEDDEELDVTGGRTGINMSSKQVLQRSKELFAFTQVLHE
jgi:hypothetical protein